MKHQLRYYLLGAIALTTTMGASALSTLVMRRLTPAEIGAISIQDGGTGSSGLTSISTTVLSGDPTQKGLYTIKLGIPPHTRIRAHTHSDDRAAIVISGEWYFGYGNEFDSRQTKVLGPGSFYTEPSRQPHFAETRGEAVVVYITGNGPTDTQY